MSMQTDRRTDSQRRSERGVTVRSAVRIPENGRSQSRLVAALLKTRPAGTPARGIGSRRTGLGVIPYLDPPSPGSGEAGGAGGLLLDQRADGAVRPVDAVEVEHHQLRVLQLVLVRLASGAGDRLDPECRLGPRGIGVASGRIAARGQERRVGGAAAGLDG